MARPPASAEMIVTELRRSGRGALESTPTVFKFTGAEHSSAQGEVAMPLKTETSRHVIPHGNRVVEHLMHSTWQSVTFSGEWQDKWANRSSPPGSSIQRTGSFAHTMYQEFARMVQRMVLVRVELDAISLVGVITEFTPTFVTKGHYKWSFVLSPHQNESVSAEATSSLTSALKRTIPKWLSDASELSSSMQLAFDAHLAVIPLRTTIMSKIFGLISELSGAVSRLNSFGTSGLDSDAVSQLKLMATTFQRVYFAGLKMYRLLAEVTSSDDVAFNDAMVGLTHSRFLGDMMTSAWRAVGFGAEGRRDMLRRVTGDVLAIYHPKRGESMERISMRFYGSPDSWRVIYDRNHLKSLIMDGTEELVIPTRRK